MAGILEAQVQEISQSTEKKIELEIMREKKDKQLGGEAQEIKLSEDREMLQKEQSECLGQR